MELLQAIKERRSIRKYKTDPIPKELLEELVHGAMWAPSAMNTQPWKFFVLTGEKKEQFIEIAGKSIANLNKRLLELFDDKMKNMVHGYFKDLGGAPAVVVVLTSLPEHPIYKVGSYQSASAAFYNFLLLAYEAGLGTCWMTGPLWVEKELVEFLGQPDLNLLGLTPVGYPDQTPPVPPRKDEEVIWLD